MLLVPCLLAALRPAPAGAEPLVRIEGRQFIAPDGTPLVRDLSFTVEHGTSVLLMGPNGCGKSRCGPRRAR